MSDRVRLILILTVILGVTGGGGYYFFKVYRPAQDLKNAQEEIAAWEERYQAARDCLLGKTPGSSKTSEALAIREMAPDPWDRGKCTPLIGKLSRGPAPDSGLPAVENMWGELDKAATKAALAYAKHVSESTTLEVDPLPEGLDALDAARRNLRKAARMSDDTQGGKVLTVAQIVPIADGTNRLERLKIDTIPSAHGLALFGSTKDRQVQVTLTAGAKPKVDRIGPLSFRSVPDTSWGASQTAEAILAGAFDVEGAMATPTKLPLANATIAAVVGTLADGHLVYGNATELVIARAKDGTITPAAPEKIEIGTVGIDVDGRAAVIWGNSEGTKGLFLGEQAPVELPPAPGYICLTKDRAWTQSAREALAFGGGKPTLRQSVGYAQLQGCTSDYALFHTRGDADSLTICGDTCRETKLPKGAPKSSATTVVGGKLVAIASHAGVLGVWREGSEPTFYSLSQIQASPVLAHEWPAMALTDGKVIDVIARGSDTFVLIRIPAQ